MTAETPHPHQAAKDELLSRVEAAEELDLSTELDEEKQRELADGTITHLRSFLTGQEGEDADTVATEAAALRSAVREVAYAHEGVSETLIMMWINGEEIGDQMVGLHERGIRTFRDLREDPEAVAMIQRIGTELGHDLTAATEGEYDDVTREAWAQIQADLSAAGYELGDFSDLEGGGRNGHDGLVGQVTMNILMSAAQSVAPDDVVEDAIAEVAYEDRSVERRTNEFNAIGVDGETSTPRTGEISEEHINEYASVLARGIEGVQYDAENQTFTHTLTDETLAVGEVVSGNYEDVDRAAMQSSLTEFNTAQVNAFAEAQGVEVVDHEGSPHFEAEGRMMSVHDILSDQQPLEMFEQWKNGEIEGVEAEVDDDYEETEIPPSKLRPLTERVRDTDGVRTVEDRGDGAHMVVLFDGSEISLNQIFAEDVGESEINAMTRLDTLRNGINAAAEIIAGEHGLIYRPQVDDPGFQPAQFLMGEEPNTQFAFRLSEIDAEDIDDTITERHEGAEDVFSDVLSSIAEGD